MAALAPISPRLACGVKIKDQRRLSGNMPSYSLRKSSPDAPLRGRVDLAQAKMPSVPQPNRLLVERELGVERFRVRIEEENEAPIADQMGRAVHLVRRGPVGQVLADFQVCDVLPPPVEPLADFRLVCLGDSGLRGQKVELVRRARQGAEQDIVQMPFRPRCPSAPTFRTRSETPGADPDSGEKSRDEPASATKCGSGRRPLGWLACPPPGA